LQEYSRCCAAIESGILSGKADGDLNEVNHLLAGLRPNGRSVEINKLVLLDRLLRSYGRPVADGLRLSEVYSFAVISDGYGFAVMADD
jgi:hypothetical protein